MINAVIGPPLLAGIGQQGFQYTAIIPNCKYMESHNWKELPPTSTVMVYAIPTPGWIQQLKEMVDYFGESRILLMTICETETVHEDYGELFKLVSKVATPSKFCKRVFERQFPNGPTFYVVNAYVKDVGASVLAYIPRNFNNTKYTFYHIGNILDQRKNISGILSAFKELFSDKLDTCRLVLKATCNRNVEINDMEGVEVINGLLPAEEIEKIHNDCDCYVSFSHSEGIGLGAVEAAMRAKPVIFPEYGGASEYIASRYIIPCGRTRLPADDFLFKEGMEWGDPDYNKLKEFMWDAYNRRISRMGHPLTQHVTSPTRIIRQLKEALQHPSKPN